MAEVYLREGGEWTHVGSPAWTVEAPQAPHTLEVGFNISPAGVDYGHAGGVWAGVWANWNWAGKIKRDIDLAVGLGGTIIRIIGGPRAVTDGHITQATYLQRFQQVLDYCESLGIRYYVVGVDTRIWTPENLPTSQIQALLVAQATACAAKPAAVFGMDLINEIDASYAAASTTTFTPTQIRTIAGQWAQAVKAAAPSLRITVSNLDSPRHGYEFFPELTPYLDFYDFHSYENFSIAMYDAWSVHKPLVWGEMGVLRTDPNRGLMLARLRENAIKSRAEAVIQWDITSGNYGMYDANGANLDAQMAGGLASFPVA